MKTQKKEQYRTFSSPMLNEECSFVE